MTRDPFGTFQRAQARYDAMEPPETDFPDAVEGECSICDSDEHDTEDCWKLEQDPDELRDRQLEREWDRRSGFYHGGRGV